MISDDELTKWRSTTERAIIELHSERGYTQLSISQSNVLRVIDELIRLREQMTPDCTNGCIVKQARKIVEKEKE